METNLLTQGLWPSGREETVPDKPAKPEAKTEKTKKLGKKTLPKVQTLFNRF